MARGSHISKLPAAPDAKGELVKWKALAVQWHQVKQLNFRHQAASLFGLPDNTNVQGDLKECHTVKGEKLSSSQAEPG